MVGRLASNRLGGEGPHNFPADANIDGQPWVDFDIVLNVRRDVEVSQFRFQGKMAPGGVRHTQQEASEGAAGVVLVESAARKAVAGCEAAKSEVAPAILTFVVVLVGTADLPTNIEGVPSTNPKPIVVKADAQFTVDRKRFAVTVHSPRGGGE